MIECRVATIERTMQFLQREDIGRVWNELWPRLEADESYMELYTKQWTLENLMAGHLQLWSVGDALILTQIAIFPKGKVLQIIFANGSGLVDDIPLCWEIFMRFATTQECNRIMLFGREGWTRAISRQVKGVRLQGLTLMAKVAWPKGN